MPAVPARRPAPAVPAVLALQRLAGNAAIATLAVQRLSLDLPTGGGVGDPPATNHREGVMLALNRMHELWAIENTAYDRIYPGVFSLRPGQAVTDPATLDTIQAALRRLGEPTLAPEVAAAQFGLPIGAAVGRDLPNHRADVARLQDLLRLAGHLTQGAYDREHAAATLNATTLSATFAGLTLLKRAAAAGTGKQGWSPLIRSDEAGPGGADRLADRTFTFGEFLIFVPAGATASPTNKVHVFFSAGGVLDASSHVEHHGLRGTAEGHEWILFGVRGEPGRRFTIGEDQVRQGLESVGRPARVDAVRMSAHSRGNGSLAETLRRRLFARALIDHITVLDGSDFSVSLTDGFARSGLPANRITADFVTTGAFRRPGVVRASQGMDPAGVRAVGYARLINDAVATGRVPRLPPDIAAKVVALPLPPRGTFSAQSPPPAGKVSLSTFVNDRAHRAALAVLRTGERRVANVGELAGSQDTSPYAFVEWHNLLNLNDEHLPRDQWRSVSAGIYSHHLFVSEIADDLFR